MDTLTIPYVETERTNADMSETLYVAIDVAKYFHKAIIFNMRHEILEDAFTFTHTNEGIAQLVQKIGYHMNAVNSKRVIVGLEATAHYHETLVEQLQNIGYEVMCINPYNTFKTRALRLDYVKTDEIDLKAIGEAMVLQKGRMAQKEDTIFHTLKLLTRFRRGKVRARSTLRVQMLRDLDRLWPGMLSPKGKSGNGLLTNLWESKVARGIFTLNLLPDEISQMTPMDLVRLCKDKEIGGIGMGWAGKIIEHARQAPACEPGKASIHKEILHTNLELLRNFDRVILESEGRIAEVVEKTVGIRLLSIAGVSHVTAGEFLGEIGDPRKYSRPGEWIKRAGLHASRYQSGGHDRKQNRITKAGNPLLRATLFTIARNVSRWEPFFIKEKEYFLEKGKRLLVVYGAVANKFVRIAFALLKNNVDFDADYEGRKKGGERALTI